MSDKPPLRVVRGISCGRSAANCHHEYWLVEGSPEPPDFDHLNCGCVQPSRLAFGLDTLDDVFRFFDLEPFECADLTKDRLIGAMTVCAITQAMEARP